MGEVKKGLGCILQKPEVRLQLLREKPLTEKLLTKASALPDEYDPRGLWIPPYDQLQIGSCVGNGTGGIVNFNQVYTKYPWPYTPSRLFIYYNARSLDGDTDQDAGTTITQGINAIKQFGVCPESGNPAHSWAYIDNGVQFKTKPTDACYTDALLHVDLDDQHVDNSDIDTIKSLLVQNLPVVFGFVVHESFMSQAVAQSGVMPEPGMVFFDPVEGGHCVVVIGYFNNWNGDGKGARNMMLCRNSWGTAWGMGGYFLMPEDLFTNTSVASDAAIIKVIGMQPKKAA